MGEYDFFTQFVMSPTNDTYRVAFTLVTALETYNPYSEDLNEIQQLLVQEKFIEARDKAHAAMPNRVLSPRLHMLLARAEQKLNNEQAANVERSIALRCIEGILATGDGSEARPYLVTSVEDEYDVLGALGKKHESQAAVQTPEGRYLDVLHCNDGDVHFDITVARHALDRQFHP